MSRFTGPLTLTEIDLDTGVWELAQPLVYAVGDEHSAETITVPAGTRTNLISIPWIVSIFMQRWGRWGRPAVVHDYLYILLARGTPHARYCDRRCADAIFHEALLVAGVSRPLAWIMWAACRLFGRRHVSETF